MGQFDLNGALVLVRVVQAGSFRAAAERLGMPKTTVSRKVSELEAQLGAVLLQRTTRRLSLTDAGLAFVEEAEERRSPGWSGAGGRDGTAAGAQGPVADHHRGVDRRTLPGAGAQPVP